MLSNEQKKQIEIQEMPLKTVEEQLKNFEQGFPFLEIQNAATIGDGIQVLNEQELQKQWRITKPQLLLRSW